MKAKLSPRFGDRPAARQLNALRQVIGKLPRPRTDAELAVLAELCFGRPVRLSRLYSNSYEAEPDFVEMFSKKFRDHYGVGGYEHELYDYAAAFWNHVCGQLYCGGIARASYGQFKVVGHRNARRLEHWELSRRKKDGHVVRATFARLAGQLRDRKNREIRGIPVLIDGRADGASAVSSRESSHNPDQPQ